LNSNSLINTFYNYGFAEQGSSSVVSRVLFDDLKVVVECEEGWVEDGFVTFYIYASEFSRFIEKVFLSLPDAQLIQPRKLVQDRSGCLCMASSPVELIEGEWTVWLSGEETRLDDLLQLFSKANSDVDFYKEIYLDHNRYFIWVESIWVYLFLRMRLGVKTPSEIIDDLNQSAMKAVVKRWNLKSDISLENLSRVLKLTETNMGTIH
jgi:hypothetical protein